MCISELIPFDVRIYTLCMSEFNKFVVSLNSHGEKLLLKYQLDVMKKESSYLNGRNKNSRIK